jgi:hypothetical protein
MGFNDRTADGKTEAHAIGFGRDEGLEQPIEDELRQSGSVIRYDDLHILAVEQTRAAFRTMLTKTC